MLPLGKIGRGHGGERDCRFTFEEQKTMMTLWCIFRSPMMIGAELTMLDGKTTELLTNADILEMLGDGRGVQLRRTDNDAVWLSEGSSCLRVALFNLSDESSEISADIEKISEYGSKPVELWGAEPCKLDKISISAEVPAHGVRIYRFGK